ncbi:MAG TPA: GyrI-like domain-containing protein, partial [Methanobacterium sp.]
MAYLREKNKCPGCRVESNNKRDSIGRCKIKNCEVIQKDKLEFCSGCDSFPCRTLENLDKRYRTKYNMSMVENLENIQNLGMEKFLENEDKKWTCFDCGGTICVHKGYCYGCGKIFWRIKKMVKIDLKKEDKELYNPSKKEPSLVEVPEMRFLMMDGEGDPNTSQEYQDAMEALFPVSYKTKFISKRDKSKDYVVMPMEGLWWVDNMEDFTVEDKSGWKWTVMVRQPDFISERMIKSAIREVEEKKNLTALSKIRFEKFYEGLSAQIMHIGPYSEEGPTVEKLHNFIHEKDYVFDGSKPGERHHEIYLSDIRRTKPERLKTIIRQPVKIK